MSVHANSVQAYHEEEPKLSKRAAAILAWILEHGPHTDREVMQGMGFPDMNNVRPRITELIDAAKLMEVGDVICPVTGKRVRRVDVRRPRGQLSFSLEPDLGHAKGQHPACVAASIGEVSTCRADLSEPSVGH